MAALPKSSLQALSVLMFEASKSDEDDKPPKLSDALMRLGLIECEGLDSYLDEPIVAINPAASSRDVRKSINEELNRWKRERGLPQQRSRPEKLDSYLRVWDMREGWTGAAYDRSQEMTLRDAAKHLQQSISTVNNHYRRAFELIVGHQYRPEVWGAFFGVLKLTGLIQQPIGKVARRRPHRSRQRLEVPETKLMGSVPERSAEGVMSFATSYADQYAHEIVLDVKALLEKGKSPNEIATELELPAKCIPEIETLSKLFDPGPVGETQK